MSVEPCQFVYLYWHSDRRTGTQSCLDICLASCNLVDLCSLTESHSYEGCWKWSLPIDHFSWCSPKSHIIGRPPRWKVKDADWGLWASKIPDSALESSNSATELNDDLKKRIDSIEQASTTVLVKTSPVPFTRRKTPWWNGLWEGWKREVESKTTL